MPIETALIFAPTLRAGAKFSCFMIKNWRHLDFFQLETYVTARVPRVKCGTCGIHQVCAPWAREGSGFTLLFERRIIDLAPVMPVKTLGQKLGVTDTRVWRLVKHHLNRALEKLDLSRVTRVGFDETSSRRGHDYVSIFVDLFLDLDTRRAIFAMDGKDSSVVARFRVFLTEHGGRPENIRQLCCDMSPAFIMVYLSGQQCASRGDQRSGAGHESEDTGISKQTDLHRYDLPCRRTFEFDRIVPYPHRLARNQTRFCTLSAELGGCKMKIGSNLCNNALYSSIRLSRPADSGSLLMVSFFGSCDKLVKS